MEKDIQLLFSLIHVRINNLDDLPGTIIPRESLLSEESYHNIKENIDNFKKYKEIKVKTIPAPGFYTARPSIPATA